MDILSFKNKYANSTNLNVNEFWISFEQLMIECEKNKSLKVCFETLLEEHYPGVALIKIIERSEVEKKLILESKDTFKWACCFGDEDLIKYLNNNSCYINIDSAIIGAINQYRLDNLKILNKIGYSEYIFTENHFLHAISRSEMVGCDIKIVNFFIQNKDKFKFDLNKEYTNKSLLDRKIFERTNNSSYVDTFKFFINWNNIENQKNLNKLLPDMIESFFSHQKIEYIKSVLKSNQKDILLNKFNINKTNWIKEYFSLREEDKSFWEEVIKLKIIKKEDLKLWMMNANSLDLVEYIQNFRKINKSEIKKSFIELSKSAVCFSYISNKFTDFNYNEIEIGKVIEILNNCYEQNDKSINDDISEDSVNMILYRNILLNHPEFLKYEKEIKEFTKLPEIINILYKEKLKEKLSVNLSDKGKVKQRKI